MRFIVLLVVVTGTIVAGLATWSATHVARPAPVLFAFAGPSTIYENETVTMFGGLYVPVGTFEVGTYACMAGSCRRLFWRLVDGPGELWSGLGSVRLNEVGVGTIEVHVFEADAVTDRIVGVWRREVNVIAGDESPSAHSPKAPTLAKVR